MFPYRTTVLRCEHATVRRQAEKELAEAASCYRALAVDVETSGLLTLENRLKIVTIATPDTAFVYTPEELHQSPFVQSILINPEVQKMAHSAAFDWSFLLHHGGLDIGPNLWDTKKQAKAGGIMNNGLHSLVRTLLGWDMSKTLAISFAEIGEHSSDLTNDQLQYTANDALSLWPIRAALHARGYHQGAISAMDMAPMIRYLYNGGPWPKHGEYMSLDGCKVPGCTLIAVEQDMCVVHSSMLRKDDAEILIPTGTT